MKQKFSQENKAKIDDSDPESFWKIVNLAYEALRNDPIAWQKELDERSAWEVTLNDGLEEE
ncbi:TPA: hypothetical protein ENS27_02825 [bacterium]|jgi:hypothetical protein|nr:hypothetical protein [bacterium]